MKFQTTVRNYSKQAKNAGIYLLATTISSALGVIINPFLALNLSTDDYAIMGYFSAFTTLFAPLLGFFLIDFYLKNRFILQEDALLRLKATIIKSYIWISGVLSLICLIGLYLYMSCIEVSIPFFPYAIFSILCSYLGLIFAFKNAELKINREAKSFFYLSLIYGVLNAALAILLVVIIKWGAFGRLLASVLVGLILFVYCLYEYRGLRTYKFDYTLIKPFLKYSTPLVLTGMLGFFTLGYDKVLLERRNDLYALGIYSVALQMSSYINIFSNGIKSTFQPDVYQAIAEKNTKKLYKVISVTVLSVSAIVIVYIICAPFLINILTAGRYTQATGLSQVLALSVISSTIYYQISQVTYGSGLSHLTLINKIIGSIISAILFLIVIPAYGVYGAAWCVVMSFLIYAIGNIILLVIHRKGCIC